MAKERQGNLPSLETMSKVDLQDLLNRQEKILTNKKFLRTLKDKGEKIETFAEKLKQAIIEREDVDATAQLFERMDLGHPCIAEEGVVERIPLAMTPKSDDTDADPTVKQSNTITRSGDKHDNPTIHPTVKQSNTLPNVFLKTHSDVKNKHQFLAHKSLKSTSIPKDFPKPNVPEGKSRPSKNTSSDEGSRPPEHTAATPPPMKHAGTQPMGLNESVNLLETQKKKVDELVAQQAAQKLAERMHIKLAFDQYSPALADLRYRDQDDDEEEDTEDEDDSDDEADNEDVENN